ncbi:glycoside hydrolase family protein [Bacteroidota bacterium]
MTFSQDHKNPESNTFADCWEYIGIAAEEPGYHIWGSSPIVGPEGKTHLFVARWPSKYKVDPGWRSHSEIAHYISENPESPFEFSDVALTGTGGDTWDRYAAHNPAIHKMGDKYFLLYIANDNPEQPPHPSNQAIGIAISDNLNGPWHRVGKDGNILRPPEDPEYWNFNPSNGVNNPALLQTPEGTYFLYFKSQGGKMGLAIANKIDGPYIQLPLPVTQNDQAIEDGYAFMNNGEYCLLTTDNHGLIEKGGGILWKSEDGIHYNEYEQGFYPVEHYLGKRKLRNAEHHYGGKIIKFERPQVLMIDNKPAYMYTTSGYHFRGRSSTVSYVLKFKK